MTAWGLAHGAHELVRIAKREEAPERVATGKAFLIVPPLLSAGFGVVAGLWVGATLPVAALCVAMGTGVGIVGYALVRAGVLELPDPD